VKMASNTTEGVSQPTSSFVTAIAGDPTASEDQFDPFLPVVEERSLQESMDVNKECEFCFFHLHLQSRLI